MWVVDHDNSKRLTARALKDKLSQEDFESMILDVAYPVNIETGQAHLFHQEILHGNINNDTSITRMSIDWHILLKGDRDIAKTGVDFISVGALTKNIQAVDLSMRVDLEA
jgi:nicotinate-nucleotide pyrophosphorylase (carboxylating)